MPEAFLVFSFFYQNVIIFDKLQRTYAENAEDIYEVGEKDKKCDKTRPEKTDEILYFLSLTEHKGQNLSEFCCLKVKCLP